MRVKEEMVEPPVAVSVPSTRRELLALFHEHGHAGFPVIKAGARKLVGVVTRQHLFEQLDESQVALLMDPNPPTTYPEAPVAEAARLIAERGVRVLPVVNGANDLVGVLSPAEVLRALPVPTGHLAPFLRGGFVPVHGLTPAPVALEILRSTRVRALPLLDDEGRYAGLVTDRDLLAAARVQERTVRTTAGMAGEGDAWKWERLRDDRRVHHSTTALVVPPGPVSALERRETVPLGPNATLRDAVTLALERRLHDLPIVEEGGRLLGLVGEIELVEALLPAAARRP